MLFIPFIVKIIVFIANITVNNKYCLYTLYQKEKE